jgi:hypothetical protein
MTQMKNPPDPLYKGELNHPNPSLQRGAYWVLRFASSPSGQEKCNRFLVKNQCRRWKELNPNQKMSHGVSKLALRVGVPLMEGIESIAPFPHLEHLNPKRFKSALPAPSRIGYSIVNKYP